MLQLLLESDLDLKLIIQPVLDLCYQFVPILLSIVGAVGAIWVILLGVKFAKADEPQEHEKAKKALTNAIIGFILIFVLLVILFLAEPALSDWYYNTIV